MGSSLSRRPLLRWTIFLTVLLGCALGAYLASGQRRENERLLRQLREHHQQLRTLHEHLDTLRAPVERPA